jgi:predicted kinase
VLLRSDVERKALFDARETDRLPPEAYSVEATEKVYASLCEKAHRIVAAGHSAIVDAVFARESERAAIEQVATSCGVASQGLFLTADLKTRIARVGTRTGDASDADANVVRQQETYDVGTPTWTQVDASGTPDETLHHARAALVERI